MIAIAAMNAGKAVDSEKLLVMTIDVGRAMVNALREHQRHPE